MAGIEGQATGNPLYEGAGDAGDHKDIRHGILKGRTLEKGAQHGQGGAVEGNMTASGPAANLPRTPPVAGPRSGPTAMDSETMESPSRYRNPK